MKSFILSLFLILTAAPLIGARAIKDIPNVHLADSTRFVSDPDGYMSAAAIARADSVIGNIWRSTTSEVVTVVVRDLDGNNIDDYATALFEQWGIGKKDTDNGLLILISVDDRKAALRTGRGMEIALNDARCGRIIRNVIAPAMKEGDVDNAVINSAAAVGEIVTDPTHADDLISKYANNAGAGKGKKDNFFHDYLMLGLILFAGMTVWVVVVFLRSRGMERHERYEKLRKLRVAYLALTVGFVGIPVLSYLLLMLLMKRARRARTLCPNCNHAMRLIDEVHDNDYLTPAQDREENIGSVDYDVWHCDECGTNRILPYINHNAPYKICPVCGSRAEVEESNTVLSQPSTTAKGIGEKTYFCKNCNKRRRVRYEIPKVVAPPVIIPMGGFGRRGGGGFGGGGFGGGSFGGGMTGGGGASGGW